MTAWLSALAAGLGLGGALAAVLWLRRKWKADQAELDRLLEAARSVRVREELLRRDAAIAYGVKSKVDDANDDLGEVLMKNPKTREDARAYLSRPRSEFPEGEDR